MAEANTFRADSDNKFTLLALNLSRVLFITFSNFFIVPLFEEVAVLFLPLKRKLARAISSS